MLQRSWAHSVGTLVVCALAIALITGHARAQPLLQVNGQPYLGGTVDVSIQAPDDVGAVIFFAIGTDPLPLDAPAFTGKGPFYIGNLVSAFVLATVPSSGVLSFPLTMPPPMPGISGVHFPIQVLVGNQLSNPATLILDQPYFEPSTAITLTAPVPSPTANFGDRVAIGDLNDDGINDIAVGAWFEDYQGVTNSGRAYVFWGPDYSTSMTLSPESPLPYSAFGSSVVVHDLTGDGIDDLLISEASAYPAEPDGPGYLHLFEGGSSFSTTPLWTLPSLETGVDVQTYSRRIVVGDFNDDDAPDLAVSIFDADDANFTDVGRVDVLWGPAYTAYVQIENPDPKSTDHFGGYLAVGDVNGDQIDDLIVGGGRIDVGNLENLGRVFAFTSPALVLNKVFDYPLMPAAFTRFGEDTAAGDLNGDGMLEVIAGTDRDEVFIFWSACPGDWVRIPKPPSSYVNPFGDSDYGSKLAVADVNQDGYGDVLISDIFEGDSACSLVNSGAVYVAMGPYYSTFTQLFDPNANCGDGFGRDFALGQLGGTAFPELAVGVITSDDGGVFNAGHVTILGN